MLSRPLLLLSTLFALALPSGALPQSEGRVIVLGFDGVDARTTEALMDAGQLPNFARLRDQGTFAPMLSTNPAESPVSWAALNSGQNPAKTGVPAFVKRDFTADGSPTPNFGLLNQVVRPIGDFAGATPIPTWDPNVLGGAIGGAVLIAFFVVFAFLLKFKKGLSALLAIVLAGVGFWGGRELRGALPNEIPKIENPNEAEPFWETAAKQGVRSVVLDAAQVFDRDPVEGTEVLAGLGVPDARGQYNSYFLYTTDELEFERGGRTTDSNNLVFRVDVRSGVIQASLPGPVDFVALDRARRELADVDAQLGDPKLGYDASKPLNERKNELQKEVIPGLLANPVSAPLEVRFEGDEAVLTLGTETQRLKEGAWSDWFHLTFELSALVKVHAVTRTKLIHLEDPHFELYVNALEIDPAAPPFWQPISQPPGYAPALAHACGPFETVGWACMNLPYKDREVSAEDFLEDIQFTLEWREDLMRDQLARDDWRLFFGCESTPDRVQHMMYQFYDETNPLYDAEAAARTLEFCGETITLAESIPASYRRMDTFVGEVLDQHVGPDDTLLVVSDHGFQNLRRQVWINNWLHERGYLAVKAEIGRTDRLDGYIDWENTQAYSLGLGGIFVNLEGREGDGTVEPAEQRALMERIRADFQATRDAATGELVCDDVLIVGDAHAGPYLDREPDMLVEFNPGYRVSWGTTMGGMNPGRDPESGAKTMGDVFEDNDNNWSGYHVTAAPKHVRGIFVSNRRFADPEAPLDLRHVAPTVLSLLGLPIPEACDLPALQRQ